MKNVSFLSTYFFLYIVPYLVYSAKQFPVFFRHQAQTGMLHPLLLSPAQVLYVRASLFLRREVYQKSNKLFLFQRVLHPLILPLQQVFLFHLSHSLILFFQQPTNGGIHLRLPRRGLAVPR